MSEQQGGDRLKAAADDGAVAEPFDQTNGMAGGLDGDSDETAVSDTASGAERDDGDGAGIDGTDDVAGQGAMGAGFIVGRQQ